MSDEWRSTAVEMNGSEGEYQGQLILHIRNVSNQHRLKKEKYSRAVCKGAAFYTHVLLNITVFVPLVSVVIIPSQRRAPLAGKMWFKQCYDSVCMIY